MDYNKIKFATLEAYKQLNIKSFPVDCIDILVKLGMRVQTYSEQNPKKKEKCIEYSEDAFTLRKTVYYNELMPQTRINFTLAHEIAHIVLKHSTPRTHWHEKEADCFASYFLAPRMAIHYSKCKNYTHVSKLFEMSLEASNIAFDDYRRWHRKAVYKMDSFDKGMYSHFYNKACNGFVYKIKECSLCKKEMINDLSTHCPSCHNKLAYIDMYRNDSFFGESEWKYRTRML